MAALLVTMQAENCFRTGDELRDILLCHEKAGCKFKYGSLNVTGQVESLEMASFAMKRQAASSEMDSLNVTLVPMQD